VAPAARADAIPGPRAEGQDTPKICLEAGGNALSVGGPEPAGIRRVKQLGVDHLMIFGFPNTIYGRPGRDEEIEKVRQSIRVAGRVGLPVVEYNFYAHRIVEGYYEETGRARG
jgi:hypothetical protein